MITFIVVMLSIEGLFANAISLISYADNIQDLILLLDPAERMCMNVEEISCGY